MRAGKAIAAVIGVIALVAVFLLGAVSPARAQCSNTAPASGTTVTCSGTSSTPVVAASGSTGVTINADDTSDITIIRSGAGPFPVLSVDTSSAINNSGAITLMSGTSATNRGAVMLGAANMNTLTNAAGATITTTGASNDGMDTNGSNNTLINNGMITIGGPSAFGMSGQGQFNDTLVDNGTVTANGNNSRAVSIGASNGTIMNNGTLSTSGNSASTVFTQGNNDQLVNSGTITASGTGAEAVFSNTVSSAFTATIQNLAGGVISSTNGIAVRSLNAATTVINAGTITSGAGTAISMGNGNDSLVLQTGSSITGTADGGGGTNTLTLQGSGTASNPFTNFQTLNAQGGTWNWTGTGTFTSVNVQSGTLDVQSGTLGAAAAAAVSPGATLEATASLMPQSVTNDGSMVFNQAANETYAPAITGSGSVTALGPGTLTLTGDSTYTGGTLITQGGNVVISADSNLGAPASPLTLDNGTLSTTAGVMSSRAITIGSGGGTFDALPANPLDFSQAFVSSGALSGPGGITKTGPGTVILDGDNSYAGPTMITQGFLYINGDASAATGPTTVASGARLGGQGTVGGDVSIASGATLGPGFQPMTPGTLTINGNLSIAAGANVFYNVTQANQEGGALNDLTVVHGNLTLGGTINVLDQGQTLGPGVYRIFNYDGTLTNNGLMIGSFLTGSGTFSRPLPSGLTVQTAIDHQVNLINSPGIVVTFWDGDAGPKNDGEINGGDGVWQNLRGNNNWTNADGTPNTAFADQSFPVFTAVPGTVRTDASLGPILVAGMQFAVDGYRVTGDPINLVDDGGVSVVRVGDGTSASAAMTATIDAVIAGQNMLMKTDLGTLVLTAANTYAGGTNISGGVLQISSDANLGAASGPLALDFGTLRTTASMASARPTTLMAGGGTFEVLAATTLTLSNVITGPGALTKTGGGTLTLTGAGTYTGGTLVSAGTLQLGDGGASGSITGDVTDNATLAFNRGDVVTFPGVISGTGAVSQIGAGTTVLTAVSPYTGGTAIAAGALAVGDAAHPGAALSGGGPVNIAPAGTLAGYGSVSGPVANNGMIAVANALPAFAAGPPGTLTINGNLQNAGTMTLASPAGTTGNVLRVNGNFSPVGANSTLVVNTFLNGGGPLSNQFTDRLLITGDPAGSTLVRVINPGGPGRVTTTAHVPTAHDGISIVEVAGASTPTAFVLPGGFANGGTPFQFHLNAYGPGSPNGPADPTQDLVGNAPNQWDYRLQDAVITAHGPLAPGEPTLPGARRLLVPQVPAYLSAARGLFQAGLLDIGTLHQRLGEIRDDQTMDRQGQGEFFIRAYGGLYNYTTNRNFVSYGYNFNEDYAAVQFGGSYNAIHNEYGTLRVGVAGAIGRMWLQPSAIDGLSKTLFNTQNFFGTVTWQDRLGWYVDGVVMGGLFDGRYTTPDRGQTTGMNGTSVGASIETGIPFPLPWDLSFEPQAQLVWQRLNFQNRTDVDLIDVELGNPDQVTARVGFRLKRPFQTDGGMRFTPYFKANVLQGIGSSGEVALSGFHFGTGNLGTELQVGGGVTGTLTSNLSVFGDVSWQSEVGNGGGFRGWTFNGGLRWLFDQAPAPAPSLVPASAAPAPLAARSYLVFFDWDKATLTARARQIIREAAESSTHVRYMRIDVNGHTDTTGTPSYNQGLSLRRAQAVAGELVRDGVPAGAISIRGYGQTNLLVPTGPRVREPQNRRVEIVVG